MPDPVIDDPKPLPDTLSLVIQPASATSEPDPDKPLAEAEFLKIELTEDERHTLAEELLTQIDDTLTARKDRAERVVMYRNQYRQLLRDSSYPFPGAFNLNVPLTANKIDTAMAETSEVFEQTDPKWTVQGPPSEALKDAIRLQQDALDAYEDLVEGSFVSSKTFFDAWLLGNGWEARVFKHEIVRSLEQRTWRSLAEFTNDFPDHYKSHPNIVSKLTDGGVVTRVLELTQDLRQAPVSEHVEWEDAIVPLYAEGNAGLRTARLLGRRVWMDWTQVAELEREGDYLAGVAEELQYKPVENKPGERGEFNPDYQRDKIETFECQYFMRVKRPRGDPKETILVRCLINVARDRRLILRAIRYPYAHQRPYLITHVIQETEAGIYQPGLGEKLQQVNLSANALLAHVLNAGLIATSISFKVRTNTDTATAMFEKQWFPGSLTELSNLDDAQQWQFQMPDLGPMVTMFSLIMAFGDDVTGLTSNLAGAIDQSDPNAPGNKTAMLLARASKKLRRYITSLQKSVNESGYQAMRLIAQYIPATKVAAILGEPDDKVEAMLKMRLPTVMHAAAFDVDRFQRESSNRQWLGLLLKEPLIVQDTKKRIALYKIMAETDTTGWRGHLEELFPQEEIDALMDQAPAQPDKTAQTLALLKQKALDAGKTPEEADQIAQMAIQRMVGMAGANGGGGATPVGGTA